MAVREHKQQTAPFALNPPAKATPDTGFLNTLGAAWEVDSPVKAYWDLITTPPYQRDRAFNALDITRTSKYWDTPHRMNFADAVSQEHWQAIADKIERETKARETLEAAGWGGTAASLAMGIASPTMLIPGLTPLRGARGILAASGLGVLATSLDELPLQLNQETRTASDAIMAIGAGAFLGGVLGGAANAFRSMGDASRAAIRAELDMVASISDKAISPSARLATAPVIIRGLDEASVVRGTIVEMPELPLKGVSRFVVADAEDIKLPAGTRVVEVPEMVKREPGSQVLEPAEVSAARVRAVEEGFQALTYMDKDGKTVLEIFDPALTKLDDNIVVVQDGELYVPPRTVPTRSELSAARTTDTNDAGGLARGPAGVKVDKLAAVSPVARLIAQETFAVARRAMAALSQGGMRLMGNAQWLTANAGGTVEDKIRLYDIYVMRLIDTVDSHYAQYLLAKEDVGTIATTKARLLSTFRATGEKMTREEFSTEISRAMWTGDIHPVAEVQKAAKLLRDTIYNPILREAENVRLFEAVADEDAIDPSYLTRAYNKEAISANPTGFINILARHFERKLQDRVARESDRVNAWREQLQRYLDDIDLDEEAARARRADLEAEYKALGEIDDEVLLKAAQREARALRKQARNGTLDAAGAGRIEEVQAEISALKEELAPRLAQKSELRTRLRNLNRTYWALEDVKAEKLGQIERLEDAAFSTLNALVDRGMKIQRDVAKWDKRKLKKELELLSKQIANANESLLRGWTRLDKEMQRQGKKAQAVAPFWAYQTVDTETGRVTDIPNTTRERLLSLGDWMEGKINDLERSEGVFENIDELREWIDVLGREGIEAKNELNLMRGERRAKLKDQIEATEGKIERARGLADRARQKMASREIAARERLEAWGLTDVDLITGTSIAREVARDAAEKVTSKILGMNERIVGLKLLGEERGAELARVLDVPSMDLFDYLDTDINRVTRNYLRQVSADIELKRQFGDVNAKNMFESLRQEYFDIVAKRQRGPVSLEELDKIKTRHESEVQRLTDAGASKAEMEALRARHAQEVKEATAPAATPEQMKALEREYNQAQKILSASISRLRHTYGIPTDPEGMPARLGKVLLDLSTLRLMGGVLISSIPDLARTVSKHGIERAFRDGFMPLITNFKAFKMSAEEVKRTGAALDPYIHSRALAFSDALEESVRATRPERIIHTMASKIGTVAGFDYWTSGMKQLNGVILNARFMDSLEMVMKGSGNKKQLDEAITFLAEHNINEDLARRMWNEIENGGSSNINGVRFPNTEDWTDPQVVRAYRAALRQATENTIITPGLELPLIANANMPARLLFQFKSFALASHTKTLVANLQQRDMAVLNGMLFSVALGMLSYYLYASAVGGKTEETMRNADFGKWVDEGLNRSGLLGILADGQKVLSRVPGVGEYVRFSNEPLTFRGGGGLVETIGGPTLGLANTSANVITGLTDPTQSTVRNARTMLPYHNVFWLRRLFDLAEEEVGSGLPARRGE